MTRPASDSERLAQLLSRLPAEQRGQLLEFAEFLVARHGVEQGPAPRPEPVAVPRPERESVVGAIKRLSASYPMLDRSRMLHETSALMTQHVMSGREAVEVIDELERVFRRHYELQFPER